MGRTRGGSTAAKSSRAVRFQKLAQEFWQNNMAAQKDVDELKTCRSALSRLLHGSLASCKLLRPPERCQPNRVPRWAEDVWMASRRMWREERGQEKEVWW